MKKSEKEKRVKKDEKANDEILDKIVDDEIKDDDEFELEPEENPHIDDFTSSNGGVAPVTSIKVSEEDRLKVLVAQLQIQNMELESKILEQKHGRKIDELNRIIADYKSIYNVPDEWKLHAPTGTFNKP